MKSLKGIVLLLSLNTLLVKSNGKNSFFFFFNLFYVYVQLLLFYLKVKYIYI